MKENMRFTQLQLFIFNFLKKYANYHTAAENLWKPQVRAQSIEFEGVGNLVTAQLEWTGSTVYPTAPRILQKENNDLFVRGQP